MTMGEEINRFEMLYTRLRTKRKLNNTNNVLHLLLQLSGQGSSQQNNNAASNILGTVFNSKILNKLDYNAAATSK